MASKCLFFSCVLGYSLALCLPLAAQDKSVPPTDASQASSGNSAVTGLAKALVAAPTDQERNALLERSKELVTPALIQAVVSRGKELKGASGLRHSLDADTWAQELAKKLGDPVAMFEATFNTGLILNYLGKGDESIETTTRNLAVAQTMNDNGRQGLALRLLGVTSDQTGDFEVAREYYGKAMSMFTAAGDKREIASLYTNIGISYERQSNYGPALEPTNSGSLSEA